MVNNGFFSPRIPASFHSTLIQGGLPSTRSNPPRLANTSAKLSSQCRNRAAVARSSTVFTRGKCSRSRLMRNWPNRSCRFGPVGSLAGAVCCPDPSRLSCVADASPGSSGCGSAASAKSNWGWGCGVRSTTLPSRMAPTSIHHCSRLGNWPLPRMGQNHRAHQ